MSFDDVMTHRLEQVTVDGERLIEVALGHLDAQVPCCPEWDGAELLTHITRVWGFIASHVERELGISPAADGGDAGPEHKARGALARVVNVMAQLPAGRPMKTWGATQSSEFFPVRLRMETLVHRIDAEQTAGLESHVDGVDAVAGITEWFHELAMTQDARPSGSLHLHRTDGEGEWTASVVGEEIVVTAIHGKADAALRGPAADLFLTLWRRRDLPDADSQTELSVFGDRDVLGEWLSMQR